MRKFRIQILGVLLLLCVSQTFAGGTCEMTIDPMNEGACKSQLGTDAQGNVVPIGYYCEMGAVNAWGLHDCNIDVAPE